MKRLLLLAVLVSSLSATGSDEVMERPGLIKKAGYEYNRGGNPEQRYELTRAGNDKFWAYELEHLSDADKTTLEQSGYSVTAEGLRHYIEETQR